MRQDELEKAIKRIHEDASAGEDDAVWSSVTSLLQAQHEQEPVARALVSIVESDILPIDKGLEVLEKVYRAHGGSVPVLGLLGEALQQVRDIGLLNDSPPEHSLFLRVVNTLTEFAAKAKGTEAEVQILEGLSTAARMMARQKDEVAEASHRRLIELNPKIANRHYNFGLFLKTRGRFREGMVANQNAEELIDKWPEAYEWNLGICATGAGEGALALQVWKRLGQKIEMGRFNLPDGSYPSCKVRLAQYPLARRSVDSDDPGLEETIWVERLSPCHGIIRSVLYGDLGVDYGDVVLFDGAPITHHKYGDKNVPVFPHLATLIKSNYRMFDFAGTQASAGQIAGATDDLARDAVVYSHSESYVQLCANCWRDSDVDHEHIATVDKHVVTGRIAAPPDLDVRELLRQLDAATAKREPCRVYAPDLCETVGLTDRANFERRRFEMITNS